MTDEKNNKKILKRCARDILRIEKDCIYGDSNPTQRLKEIRQRITELQKEKAAQSD